MWYIALHSARFRPSGLIAGAVATVFGALIVTACAALLETGIRTPDGQDLVTMAGVFGSWTVLVTVFAVASATALAVRHRRREFALLRGIGATTGQLRRMVLAESLVVSPVTALLGAVVGAVVADRLLALVIAAGVVPAGTELRSGALSIVGGITLTVMAATVAAAVAGRSAAAISAAEAVSESAGHTRWLTVPRLVLGVLVLVAAAASSAVSLTPLVGDLPAAAAGPASVLVAVGLAIFGPGIARALLPLLGGPVAAAGLPARLAVLHSRARPATVAAAFTPLVLMIGIAMGTLYMQATENALVLPGDADHASRVVLAGANYTVSGLIIGYTAIAVVNTLVAGTVRRRRELALLRLAGATRGQVLRMVGVEAGLVTVLGAIAGTVAAATTFVPHSIAQTGSPIPPASPLIAVAVLATAAAVTLLATVVPAWRALRVPPVTALAE